MLVLGLITFQAIYDYLIQVERWKLYGSSTWKLLSYWMQHGIKYIPNYLHFVYWHLKIPISLPCKDSNKSFIQTMKAASTSSIPKTWSFQACSDFGTNSEQHNKLETWISFCFRKPPLKLCLGGMQDLSSLTRNGTPRPLEVQACSLNH